MQARLPLRKHVNSWCTGELWAGNPARLLRMLTDEERTGLGLAASRYVALIERYKTNEFVTLTI